MDTLIASLRYYVTPHHTNNHRPALMHPTILSGLVVLLLCFQISVRLIHRARPDILGFATNISIDQLTSFTNKQREEQSLSTLTLSPTLSRAAEKKAKDMFEKGYWAHNAPDGATPWDFIHGEGYRYTYAGENLARDFSYSKDVVDAWMASPSHRDNLMRPEYQEIGFAVVNGTLNGSETTLVVQMFGTKREGTAIVQETKKPIIPEVSAREVDRNPVQLGVVNEPAIDMSSLQRNISFMMLGVFMTVLIIDGMMIWKHRTVRIAGHNMAHFIFLLMIAGIVLVGTSGSVL